jgi:RHS repeat-associated protein
VYGPYGNRRVQQGTISTSKGFTGQFTDFVAGLDYYNARYYDRVVEVFVSADKVQGNMQGMDPYSYVGGNPETATDPTGNVRQGPNGATSWTNPNGDIIMSTPQGGASVIGHTHPWSPGASASGANNGTSSSPAASHPAKPSGPTVSQVVKALSSVAGVAGQVLWQAIDLVFNFSGMWHDIQTLTDENANWWVKAAAVADLGVTVFTDINMLDGEGEAARAAEVGAEIAEKGVADVTEDAGRDVVEAGCGGGLSFLFTTKVATQQGEQAIGTLKVGAKVWAYNPNTKKMELQPILHVWINHDNDLVDLTITHVTHAKGAKPVSEVIHTNKKHPFLTVEKGFLPVGQIKLGMHVVEADGQAGVISGWKVVPGVKVMYNLEVAQDHTFVVGVGMWVVHNCANPEAGSWLRESSLNDAPRQTTPGTKVINGEHVNDLGQVEPYQAHYDEYGRQIGRTDYTRGNAKAGIPPTHYHTYEYNQSYPFGHSTGDHIPGEFIP